MISVTNRFATDGSPSNSRQCLSSKRPVPGVRARNRNLRTPPAPIGGCSPARGGVPDRPPAPRRAHLHGRPATENRLSRFQVAEFISSPLRISIASPLLASVSVTATAHLAHDFVERFS